MSEIFTQINHKIRKCSYFLIKRWLNCENSKLICCSQITLSTPVSLFINNLLYKKCFIMLS